MNQPWPAGTVTVFFQSSGHLQVSIWAEAFATLIDSLVCAYYRLLRAVAAPDPTFDIDLGRILPEGTGLRLINCDGVSCCQTPPLGGLPTDRCPCRSHSNYGPH